MQPQELKSNTVKIAAYWPTAVEGESSPEAVLQQHESVRWAYSTDLQMLRTPGELIVPEGFSVVSLEEEGIPLKDFQHPPKAVYVTGNSNYRKPSETLSEWPGYIVKIDVPSNGEHPLYGHQVLAIVLNDRRQKLNEHGFEFIFDEELATCTWSVTHRGNLIGRCQAVRRSKSAWYLCHSYVEPEYRRQGIWSELFKARMRHIEGQNPLIVTSICNQTNLNTYLNYGFINMHTVEDYHYEEFLVVKDYT